MIKRLKEAGVICITPYLKIVTLLANTIYLPFNMMKEATEHIRADALNSDYDRDAVNRLCDYWTNCLTWKNRFYER